MSDKLEINFPHQHIAELSLNRADVHNALDDELIAALAEQLKQINRNKDIRAVILRANGDSFCAGADLTNMQQSVKFSEGQNYVDAMKLAELMRMLKQLTKPTIALVHGNVYGGGVGLVACCDIAIASDDAKFCLSEVKLGLIPAVISPYVIAAIGERQANRYMLTAEVFDSQLARDINLVQQVVSAEQLIEEGHTLAMQLIKNGPEAITETKQLIHDVVNQPLTDDLIQITAQKIAKRRLSDEAQEGMQAFFDKRSASWSD